MFVDKSNWAVEGFQATATYNGYSGCFVAEPSTTTSIAYVAFINDIASGCGLGGIQSANLPTNLAYSVDEFAAVGDIAFNSGLSSGECGSGISLNTPVNVNALAGTHIFIAGNFSYGNINGFCGPNSIYTGAFTTAGGNYNAGANSITVAGVSGWGVGWPIADLGSGSYANAAITTTGTTPTLTSSVSGTTIGLSNSVASPGVVSGDNIAVTTTTDGEGLILDSWGLNPYTGQAAVENNIFWFNGSAGLEVFCNSACASSLAIYAFKNTLYGNVRDYKHDGPGWGVNTQLSGSTGGTFSFTNNLVQEDVTKPLHSTTYAAWNGTTGVGQAGTGQPVTAAAFENTHWTISGNYF